MKKNILLLFLWGTSLISVFSKLPPSWCDHDLRQLEFPDSEYFTGYAEGAPMSGERQEVATQRLKMQRAWKPFLRLSWRSLQQPWVPCCLFAVNDLSH